MTIAVILQHLAYFLVWAVGWFFFTWCVLLRPGKPTRRISLVVQSVLAASCIGLPILSALVLHPVVPIMLVAIPLSALVGLGCGINCLESVLRRPPPQPRTFPGRLRMFLRRVYAK